jgi:methylase of polypeptide subunit release factors
LAASAGTLLCDELGECYVAAKTQAARSEVDRSDGGTAAVNADDACGTTIFQDREESEFYAQCVRDFLFRHGYELLENKEVVELGVGTGETIVELLKCHNFTGKINGYEIDQASYEYAQNVILAHSVADRYMVINENFFTAVRSAVVGGCVISNPPYLPAYERPAQMPHLWGGSDGSQVTKQIVECGFERLILLVSSFSNPLSIIEHAMSHGYKVLDFTVRTMRFGSYSSEPEVCERIAQLSNQCAAFVSADRYCVAGVAWVKNPGTDDLSGALARALTSLGSGPEPAPAQAVLLGDVAG